MRLLFIYALVGSGVAVGGSVPTGTILEIRLQQQISSYSSKKFSPVAGILVAPVRDGDRIVLPLGAKVSGVLRDVRRVGLGLMWETACLRIDFNRIEMPDGSVISLNSRVAEVDNARERVDGKGNIHGIRATGTLAHKTSGFFTAIAAADPLAFAFTAVASSSLLRFTEPEITFPAGTDLLVRVTEPLDVKQVPAAGVPLVTASSQERQELEKLIQDMPFRTYSEKLERAADLTNVVLLGRRSAMERAFAAAGWVAAEARDPQTVYHALRSWVEARGYQAGPMSSLLLDEHRPDYALSKSLNTFQKRHHLRVWPRGGNWDGLPVWTASSTQDIAIGFSRRSRNLIHIIDEFIDSERAKVVNDLVYTGCVDGVELVPRPWVPKQARNSNGEKLLTDNAVAVVRLNDCDNPRRSDMEVAARPGRVTGNMAMRVGRQGLLTLRNNVVRGNLVWQGADGVRIIAKMIRAGKRTGGRNIGNNE